MNKINPDMYKKTVMYNEITWFYEKVLDDCIDSINVEARDIATVLKINDKVVRYHKSNAFCTLKDHKEDFKNKPEYWH